MLVDLIFAEVGHIKKFVAQSMEQHVCGSTSQKIKTK